MQLERYLERNKFLNVNRGRYRFCGKLIIFIHPLDLEHVLSPPGGTERPGPVVVEIKLVSMFVNSLVDAPLRAVISSSESSGITDRVGLRLNSFRLVHYQQQWLP